MHGKDYIVYLEQGKRSRPVVWNSAKPLPLQHPANWVLAQTPKGLRLMEVGTKKRLSIPDQALNGRLINIPGSHRSRPMGLRIHPMNRPSPIFTPAKSTSHWNDEASEVLFCGVGNNMLAHRQVGSSFRIHVDGRLVFIARRTGDGHEVIAQTHGLTFHIPGKTPRQLLSTVPESIESWEWEKGSLRLEDHWWKVTSIPDPKVIAEGIEREAEVSAQSSTSFGWYTGIVSLLMTFLILMSPDAPKTEIKAKAITNIELKAPKIVQALPTPKPKPKPKAPEPKKEPPKLAVKKPEPPKPKPKPKIEKPREANIAKRNTAPKPAPPAPKPAAAPKVAARPPAPPKPAPKLASPAPIRLTERAAPAPRPIERNVPVNRPPPTAVAPRITAEQMAAKVAAQEAARAKAQLAQSLNFLSNSSSRPAAAMESDRIVEDANQRLEAKLRGGTVTSGDITKTEGTYLNALSTQGSAEGRRIVTRSARRISADEDAAYGGDGRPAGAGQVRGKVAASSLGSGDGSGVSLGSMGGGLDVSGAGEVAEIDIEKALEKSLARFQYCYEKVLLSDASLAGTILLEWTIDSSGRGSGVRVVRSQLNSNPLHNCLSSELARVQFPSPRGGAVLVKYPFAFSSGTL